MSESNMFISKLRSTKFYPLGGEGGVRRGHFQSNPSNNVPVPQYLPQLLQGDISTSIQIKLEIIADRSCQWTGWGFGSCPHHGPFLGSGWYLVPFGRYDWKLVICARALKTFQQNVGKQINFFDEMSAHDTLIQHLFGFKTISVIAQAICLNICENGANSQNMSQKTFYGGSKFKHFFIKR